MIIIKKGKENGIKRIVMIPSFYKSSLFVYIYLPICCTGYFRRIYLTWSIEHAKDLDLLLVLTVNRKTVRLKK